METRKKEPIPDIPLEYLKKAAEIIDKEGIPKGREAEKYVVIYYGKQYPVKHFVATGYRAWKGVEWSVRKFSGGDQTNPYLIRKGFEVRRLSGELVTLDEYRKTGYDFAPLLKDYLEKRYNIKITKGSGRAHLSLPSSTVLHVRGSKKLKRGAFYYIQEEDYHDLLKNPKWFFIAVYDNPQTSFIFPKEKLKEIFDGKPLTYQKDKKPKWYFDIRERDGRYSLVLHHGGAKEHDITGYLNQWRQIHDFANIPETPASDQTMSTTQYFLVQVSDLGSKNLLQQKPIYQHYDWQTTPRDSDHGKVRPGDILLVYFARKALDFNMLLKKVFSVDAVTTNNEEFRLTLVRELSGVPLESIRNAIENRRLSNKFEKLGQQGFNITQIDKSDFDSVLDLDSGTSVDIQNLPVFLTGYTQNNLQISKKLGILGWKQKPSRITRGSYVFVYDITNKKIDSCFKIRTESENKEPIWQSEREANPPTVQYHHRWDAELIASNLSIDLPIVNSIEPFSGTATGKKAKFGFLIGGDSPASLDKSVYAPFRQFLLSKIDGATLVEGLTLENLADAILFEEKDIKELEDLLIEKQQLIFYGPPGTSKTYVARKFASYFAGNEANVKVVQFHPSYSYEDFIEGIRPRTSENGESVGFSKQPGLFSRLVTDCKSRPIEKFVLIIDEINRGNIAKIFGELIYLLEYRDEKVFLTYSPDKEFWIPKNLYIIGTMNSADRSIAYIDYALRRRFYFKGFYPDYNMLAKWIGKNPTRLDAKEYPRKIIDTLTKVNEEIQEKFGPEYQVGHSYFMVKNLDGQRLERILEYSIKPLLEQYFYGKKDDIEDLVEACNEMLPSPA